VCAYTPIHTASLVLEPWAPAATALLTRLSAMPEVTRYIGDGSTWSRDRAEAVAAAQRDHWSRHGFGWRVAIERETDRELGFIALNFAGEGTVGLAPDEYEIGWWLDPAARGQGYAREGGAAVRDEAFEKLGAPSVIARIQPDNRPSRAVAEALGLTVDFETFADGVPAVIYRLMAARPL
jgi:RimJ/RimL family protein N-acetyltransferase